MLRPLPLSGSDAERRLLRAYRALGATDREALLAFAEFLLERGARAIRPTHPRDPQPLPRPAEETVIAAIKRLSRTYEMLDRGPMLNETSALMSAHVIQGRAAPEVIDELESLFARYYADYRATHRADDETPGV